MALFLLKALLFNRDVVNKKRRLEANAANHESRRTDVETVGELEYKACRVCSGVGEVDVFIGYKERNLAADIRACSGVPVYLNDGYSKWLCAGCLQLLQYAVKFREMCRTSTGKLLKITLDRSVEGARGAYAAPEYEPQDHYHEDFGVPSSPEAEFQSDSSTPKLCHLCKEQFNDMISYRGHLHACRQTERDKRKKAKVKKSQVHGAKEHLCETCGKALSSIHSLISHRTIHQNIFPFKCDLCPYRGKTAGLLRTHRKIHFSEKPYACSQCPKAFRTSSNLRKHLCIHKGLQESVQCALCDKTLRNKETLRGHINLVHVHRPPVGCNVCGKQFKATRALYKHRSKVHNWRAEFTGRLPAYMLCQPEDMEPVPPPHIPEQNVALTEP